MFSGGYRKGPRALNPDFMCNLSSKNPMTYVLVKISFCRKINISVYGRNSLIFRGSFYIEKLPTSIKIS